MGNKASLMLQDDEIKQIGEETGFSTQQIEKLYSRFTHLDRSNCGALSKNDLLSIPELAINPLCDRIIEMFFGGSRQAGQREDEEERINFRDFMRVLAAFQTNHTTNTHSHSNQLANNRTTTKNHIGDSSTSRPKSVATDLLTSHPSDRSHQVFCDNRSKREHKLDKRTIGDTGNNGGNDPAPVAELLSDSLRDKLYFLFKIYDADNDERISFNDLRSILKRMVGNYIEDVQLDKIATRAFVEVDRDNDGFVEFGEFCRVFAGKDMNDKLRVRFF